MPDQAGTASVLTFEAIADQQIPSSPTISPDGTLVAFVVEAASRKEEHASSAIWLSRNGEPARRFTGGEAVDTSPCWSPDGQSLAFLSDRKDRKEMAIYVLPIAGGEAQRLGDIEGKLSELAWSPDGSRLAFIQVDPETENEKKRKTEDRDDPIVFEEDLKFARLWVIEVESGKARCMTTAQRNVWQFAWHPDGQQLVYVSTPQNTINSLFTTATLWRVPVRGGLSHQIATFSPAPGSLVVRSANGEDVVVVAASVLREDPSSSLWSVPLAGGEPRKLLTAFDPYVYDVVADPTTPDGVLLRATDHVRERWYHASATTGNVTPLEVSGPLDGGSLTSQPSIAADGTRVAFTWSRTDTPAEVYVAAIG